MRNEYALKTHKNKHTPPPPPSFLPSSFCFPFLVSVRHRVCLSPSLSTSPSIDMYLPTYLCLTIYLCVYLFIYSHYLFCLSILHTHSYSVCPQLYLYLTSVYKSLHLSTCNQCNPPVVTSSYPHDSRVFKVQPHPCLLTSLPPPHPPPTHSRGSSTPPTLTGSTG